ncbi:DNA mismatch repair protein MutS, partial [Chloroflexota bacterium]
FRLGDFYETFDNDAEIVAKELHIVLTSRSMGKGNKVPLAGVPYHALDNYLSKLVSRGYKVAICEQVGQQDKGRGPMHREVTRVVTPGTVVEPNMLDGKANNYLAALVEDGVEVGLAFVDITTGEFATTQFGADKAVDEVERLQTSELLVVDELPWAPVSQTKVEARWLDTDECREHLLDHFQVKSLEGYGCDNLPLAIKAAGVVIRYLEDTNRNALTQVTRLSTYSTDSYMVIDTQTRRNLELFRTTRSESYSGSLLSVIDITKTPMGGRLIRKWLSQPLLDIESIRRRHNGVGWFYNSSVRRLRMVKLLGQISDTERIINRISSCLAIPRELVTLKKSLEVLPEVKVMLAEEGFPLVQLTDELRPCNEAIDLIDRSIRDNPSSSIGDGSVIKQGFNSELDDLLSKSKNAKKYLAEMEQTERERTGIKSLKVGYNKVFGYYIEVTASNLNQVPDEYIRRQTLVNGERYFTPQLKEFESEILNAQARIEELEMFIYRQVCAQIASYSKLVMVSAAAMAQIDVFASLAEVAVRYSYCRPEVTEDDSIAIKEGRHPVVERFLEVERYVPNDVNLSNSASQLIILTGPNMSGKSTYLRQVALIVLLAQIGSYVPAESAKIGIVDRIFTRIGAQEDLSAGQSTFMVEMVETANILNNATSKSLLILDEIGRGTSTYDGLSLAHAIAEYIHNHPKLGAKTIFATHYHELVELAGYLPRVKNFNVAVSEDEGKVVFLRKIVPGGTDRSYGIHVAQLAGLPKSVLHRAGEVLIDLEDNRTRADRHKKGGRKSKAKLEQLTLFGQKSPLLDEIDGLDISSMTPLEAINKLYELQQKANTEK